jgi:crotonobetainyl-CoA:carnitine CoA-transferase CaiB-like acyl-CoA transferase
VPVQPLGGLLVVDFTWYLPGAFASRELRRLGARVVRVEPAQGDPMRSTAPLWHDAVNAGKESVVCDLKTERGLALANALCARADVVLDGFRPGVLQRLGVRVPPTAVLCSVTGFGLGNRHERRAGHDVNYLGWAGVLADTAPALPPTQIADLAAGGLAAALEVVAALLERERTGRVARLTVSMTHGSHRLVAHRLRGPPERMLTGGLACYRLYATADGRWLTVGALEPKFWQRLCEIVGRPELAERQFDPDQEAVAEELAMAIAARPLAEWLELMDGEDVSAGPVWTVEEAAAEFGLGPAEPAPALGEHTDAWHAELAELEAERSRQRP